MTLLFEEATPFGLEIFVSVSIFSIFFDVHPDSIQKKAGPNNFCPHKSRSPWPGGVGPEENDQMRR